MKHLLSKLLHKNSPDRCYLCGRVLEEYEKTYYGGSCEKCESKITKKLQKEK